MVIVGRCEKRLTCGAGVVEKGLGAMLVPVGDFTTKLVFAQHGGGSVHAAEAVFGTVLQAGPPCRLAKTFSLMV